MAVQTQSLNQLIKSNKLNYFQVAHQAGINRTTLWGWLKFEGDMTTDQRNKIFIAIKELNNGKRK
ncbi:putative transcriptional regulator [Oenococcus oeni]|uniref:hypothetical protein n=1 Tax=Oenococcus oeni TaxID=1247 RepID=UPI00107A930A|nr:hypothetical protein [Oenococcus oeni]AVI93413.1 hypothetical protein AX764_00395 [Oenococcus oeni]SYV98426.1 putative transcriptional regulator [Oenococcus oeni]SYW04143.1 putative transcriptional regulator [Oenococcus oeni]SYW18885.1 putative transcriptional regulator [Oenococcus oeni]VDC13812.1 putative transcriptional regulator [Oenococcus oeni]